MYYYTHPNKDLSLKLYLIITVSSSQLHSSQLHSSTMRAFHPFKIYHIMSTVYMLLLASNIKISKHLTVLEVLRKYM